MGWYIQHSNDVSPEQKERARKAYDDLYRCLRSYTAAKRDYRARHIAYCLFRGKTPEQIENNYYDGKWAYDINTGYDLEKEVNKHLEQLRIDNPPREEYKEAV